MLKATSISEQRACALVGLPRDSWRQPPGVRSTTRRRVSASSSWRANGGHFGYRRIADLLRATGTKTNDKRVYRLYKLADPSVRKRRASNA
jgi:putative transposase